MRHKIAENFIFVLGEPEVQQEGQGTYGNTANNGTVSRVSRALQTAVGMQSWLRTTRRQAKEDICISPTTGDEIPISGT